jgi:dihydrofolate synthase/folylpolyglutamate synthase
VPNFQRYHEAVEYLLQKLWREMPIVSVEEALQYRIRHVLEHLGEPHKRFRVVHVGGSAGKGSTSAITASILRAAGLRTGLYIKPHLQTFIERIDVDGTLIAPDAFADIVLGLDPLVREMLAGHAQGIGFGRPALVEIAFATAMAHFATEGCDTAVVEVGLGGRTDCTNVFDAKPVTVLTNVEMEHTERLGTTAAAIAREKAAIITGREIVVTAVAQPEALAVIEARCADTGATIWRLGREIVAEIRDRDRDGTAFDLRTPFASFEGLHVPLRGAHQVTNAALAIAAALVVEPRPDVLGDREVRRGLDRVRISGRLEQMQAAPRVLLDAAHNAAEVRALVQALRDYVLTEGDRLHVVCGILGDKDQAAMVGALAEIASSVVVTQPPLVERAGDPARMVALFQQALGASNVAFEPSPAAALDLAISRAAGNDAVCATGSMYLIGELRNRWVPEDRILERRTAAL